MAENNTNNTNNEIFSGLGEGLHKVFLAGVGAMATTAEKGREIIDDLVKKGELTVEQGKQLNSELSHNVTESKSKVQQNAREAAQSMRDAAAGLRAKAAYYEAQAEENEKKAAAEADDLKEQAQEAFQAEADKLKEDKEIKD